MLFKTVALAAAISGAMAQRPSDVSICDYYTGALLSEVTAANEDTLLTLVVNTAVIGNYTMPNVGIAVPGILAAGEYMGVEVNLLPYFDGELESSNRGGSAGVSINFLDGGGAVPLTMNMPANTTTSNQYLLLTHLYEFFGVLLGCTAQGNDAFPDYAGIPSMYDVHKFMDLSEYEFGYFVTQVGLAAASFGVAEDDVTAVGTALFDLFGYKCSPPTTVVPAQGAQLQSICTGEDCPLYPNATCAYVTTSIMMPSPTPTGSMMMMSTVSSGSMMMMSTVSSGMPMPTSNATTVMSMTPTMTTISTATSTSSSSGAITKGVSVVAVLGGVFAMLL